MAREGLPHELSAIIRQAGTQDEKIVRQGLKVRTNGGYSQVDIAACRLQEPEPIRGLTLITFRSEPPAAESVQPDSNKRQVKQAEDRDEDLERQLQYMKGVAPDDSGRTRNIQRGIEVNQRGAAVHQRGTSEYQRRTGNVERGNAVVE